MSLSFRIYTPALVATKEPGGKDVVWWCSGGIFGEGMEWEKVSLLWSFLSWGSGLWMEDRKARSPATDWLKTEGMSRGGGKQWSLTYSIQASPRLINKKALVIMLSERKLNQVGFKKIGFSWSCRGSKKPRLRQCVEQARFRLLMIQIPTPGERRRWETHTKAKSRGTTEHKKQDKPDSEWNQELIDRYQYGAGRISIERSHVCVLSKLLPPGPLSKSRGTNKWHGYICIYDINIIIQQPGGSSWNRV